jgi:hypothetical protein
LFLFFIREERQGERLKRQKLKTKTFQNFQKKGKNRVFIFVTPAQSKTAKRQTQFIIFGFAEKQKEERMKKERKRNMEMDSVVERRRRIV